jgi:hypothetical protein
MSPHLRYAQAIQGRVTGRGVGIIDTLPPRRGRARDRGARRRAGLTPAESAALRRWFADYVEWMTTHEYGIAERDARNNHASLLGAAGRGLRADRRPRRPRGRVPRALQAPRGRPDGGRRQLPQETRRTKPFGYSLFNLEALAAIAQLLTTPAGRPLPLHARRRARPAPRHGVHGALHAQPQGMAVSARRDVRRGVADAAEQPALRRAWRSASRATSSCGRRCRPTRRWKK